MNSPQPFRLAEMPLRLIAFGFLLTLSSAFGQTHFISLFTPQLRAEFNLSHTEIGSFFSLATLCAAILLVWLGRLIDEVDVRYYAACVIIGLGTASALMGFVASPAMLILVFFLLRLCGQGLSSHTAITITARLATKHRGKSLSWVQLGFATGEMIAPLAVASLLVLYSWREVWIGVALVELLGVLLLAQILLAKLDHHPPKRNKDRGDLPDFHMSWSRSQVIRDKRFWRIVPTIYTPPFLMTSLLFHQANLAETKGFEFLDWATGFVAFPLATASFSLVGGVLVDRHGCPFVLRLGPPFVLLGLLMPMLPSFAQLPYLYYLTLGIGVGLWAPAFSSFWREVYGPAHLGANLALAKTVAVVISAISPVLFGLLLDASVGWNIILVLCMVYIATGYGSLLSTKIKTVAPPKQQIATSATIVR